jgi:predicted nucleic acid-binding protein
MVLSHTSVWNEHFRHGDPNLADRLSEGLVLRHPFICGELACGNLKNRAAILSRLQALPQSRLATHVEVLRLIEDRRLWRRGLGWIDVHLLASALLSNCRLWTLDVSQIQFLQFQFSQRGRDSHLFKRL